MNLPKNIIFCHHKDHDVDDQIKDIIEGGTIYIDPEATEDEVSFSYKIADPQILEILPHNYFVEIYGHHTDNGHHMMTIVRMIYFSPLEHMI
jgi:hypothetical protein